VSGVPSGVRNPRCSAHSLRRRISTASLSRVPSAPLNITPLTSTARCWRPSISAGLSESSETDKRLLGPGEPRGETLEPYPSEGSEGGRGDTSRPGEGEGDDG